MSAKPVLFAVTLCLLACAVQAVDENPFRKAKVGDWIEYKTTMKMPQMSMEGGMRQKVLAKTESSITLEVTMIMMGHETKHQTTIDLNKKYDPRATMAEQDGELKELETGTESITVAGKTLQTRWVRYEITSKKHNMTMKTKVWICPDVPMSGMVKTETELGGMGTQTMELKDYGNG